MTDRYCLLDVRGLLLKAFHGQNVSKAFWGDAFDAFLERDLNFVLETFHPREVIACWDAGNEYRTRLYADYKKGRKAKAEAEDPEEKKQMKELFDRAETFLAHLGVKNVRVPRQEADDLVALFCEKLSPAKITVYTVDADLLQLVSDNVNVLFQGSLFHSPEQKHKDVPLHLIRLHKSIVGDSSDGYSGAPGVGDKGWEALVGAYGEDGMAELEQAIATGNRAVVQGACEATGDKLLQKLLDGWAEWSLCYTLAKLHPEVCYGVLNDKIVKPTWNCRIPNKEGIEQVLYSARLLDRAPLYHKHVFTEKLITAGNVQELVTLQHELLTSPVVSYDFESMDPLKHQAFKEAAKSQGGRYVDVLSQSLTGISVNYGPNNQHTFYLSVNHAETDNVPKDWVVWLLQVLAAREEPPVVQNASFEVSVSLKDLGMDPDTFRAPYDTQIMASYVDEDMESHLKFMSHHFFRYQQTTYAELVGDRVMSDLSAMEVLSYGCDDSLVTSHLFSLFKLILQLEGTWEFYRKQEVEHVIDSSKVFIDGTRIDYRTLKTFEEEDSKLLKEKDGSVRKALEEHAGEINDQTRRTEKATTLLNEWWLMESTKYVDQPEKAQEAYGRLWERAWTLSGYTPYQETYAPPTFSLTPARINAMMGYLGAGDAPKIGKTLSGSGVRNWLDALDDAGFISGPTSLTGSEEGLTDSEKFVRALVALAIAAKGLQKRKTGDENFGGLNYKSIEETEQYVALIELVNSLCAKRRVGKLESVGDELNYGSSVQMQGLLYGKLGLPIRRRSKLIKGSSRDKHDLEGAAATGNKAIASAIVNDCQEEGWMKQLLLDYKVINACRQNQSLYYGPYPLWKHPVDGLIHPQLKNCGTVTRRPSGSSPNILQVSKKEEAKIRQVFLPWSEEYITISADYVGQEVVITACESGDPTMLAALAEGKDIHSMTSTGFAHIILGRKGLSVAGPLSYQEFLELLADNPLVAKEIRNMAKVVLFTAFYGGGYTTLAETLLIDKLTAQLMMEGMFSTYTRLRPWQEEVIDYARVHGYVLTPYGNRRHMGHALLGSDNGLRKRQERQAVNYMAQGTAADVLKVVLTEIRKRRMVSKYHMKSLRPVYDEISACVPLVSAPEYIEELHEVMRVQPPGYPLRLDIEVSVGHTWGDVKKLKDFSEAGIQEALAMREAA